MAVGSTPEENLMPDRMLEVDGFIGVNQRAKEQNLIGPTLGQEVPGKLEGRVFKNIDITDRLSAETRPGYSLFLPLSGAHSGFTSGQKILCGCDQGLVLVDPRDKSYSVLRSGISPWAVISYAKVGSRVFWTNGEVSGIVDGDSNSDWGIDRPGIVSASAVSVGGLVAGKYQVTLTFLRNGEESGATIGTPVEVSAGGGIQLTNIPQGGDSIRVYITRANQDVFLKHSDLPLGTTDFLITDKNVSLPLETQFSQRIPPGHIVRYFRGRMLVAAGKFLLLSMPLRYGLYRPSKDILPPFNDRIRIIQPVEDGFYVDDGSLHFVSFSKLDEAANVNLLPEQFGAIEGSGISVPAFWFGLESREPVAFWWTERGFPIVGAPSGQIIPVGADKMAVPKYKAGTSFLREREGIRQIITAFSNAAPVSGFAASDSLEATVYKRGLSA